MSTPIKILLIAPHCYPIMGPESNVNAKFVKMLTDGGYIVDLITVDFKEKTYPVSDSEIFFSGVNAKVIVASTPQSSRFRKILHSLKASLYIGNFAGLSYLEDNITRVIDKLCKRNKYDYVITKAGGGNAAIYCAKRYKTKLIYTFNDPYPWERYPIPYGFGPSVPIPWHIKQRLKNIAKISYKILFPSTRIMNYVLNYLPNEAHNKGIVFPHTVTSCLINNDEGNKLNAEIRILHSGSTGKWRDPQVLFEGLCLFLERHENVVLKLQFIGVEQKPLPGRSIKDYILRYHLDKYVEVLPSVSYKESLVYISESDICLILEANCEEGIFMPTKVSDYQQCGKPIWAVSPAVGVLHDLYMSNDIEYFSEVTSAISVRGTLEKIYDDYSNSKGKLNSNGSTIFYDINVIKDVHNVLK